MAELQWGMIMVWTNNAHSFNMESCRENRETLITEKE